jgi:hypothetical protein
VSAIVVIVVLAAVAVGIAATIGAGPLALLIVPVAVLVGGWMLLMGASRMKTGDIARRPERQEFLGPGGPDDPDR